MDLVTLNKILRGLFLVFQEIRGLRQDFRDVDILHDATSLPADDWNMLLREPIRKDDVTLENNDDKDPLFPGDDGDF